MARSLAFVAKTNTLAIAGNGLSVRFWDFDKNAETLIFPNSRGLTESIAITSDGKTLATARHFDVRLWDLSKVK